MNEVVTIATKTPNLGLHLTPESDVEKQVSKWRNEVTGDDPGSNMMLIDGAFKALQDSKANLVNGKIPAKELPSYVDDVLEFELYSSLPSQGEQGKIYVVFGDTSELNGQYRWSGTVYSSISNQIDFATKEEAEAGENNAKAMTALRSVELVSALKEKANGIAGTDEHKVILPNHLPNNLLVYTNADPISCITNDADTLGGKSLAQIENEFLTTASSDAQEKVDAAKAASRPATWTPSATEVGLGNVQNVSTNDQTPTFMENRSVLSRLVSGEKLSVAFGKLATAITELIAHISDNTKHVSDEEKNVWGLKENALSSAENKTTISDADSIVVTDSAAGSGTKRVTWSKTKSLLSTIFAPLVHKHGVDDVEQLSASLSKKVNEDIVKMYRAITPEQFNAPYSAAYLAVMGPSETVGPYPNYWSVDYTYFDANNGVQEITAPTTRDKYYRTFSNGTVGKWQPIATATPPEEHALPLGTGWENKSAATYWQDQFGQVTINFRIGKATIASGQLATLPVGHRSAHVIHAAAVAYPSILPALLVIEPSGNVAIHSYATDAGVEASFCGAVTFIAAPTGPIAQQSTPVRMLAPMSRMARSATSKEPEKRLMCVVDAGGAYVEFVEVTVTYDEEWETLGALFTPYCYALKDGEALVDSNRPPHMRVHAGGDGLIAPVWDLNGKVWLESATAEEIAAWEMEHPDPVTLEDARKAKLAELSADCNAAIVAGCGVTLSDGSAGHFSLRETDQINLTAAVSAIEQGAAGYPYHADGQLCKLFLPTDILSVAAAATAHKLYHTTYCNHLNMWARRAVSKAELAGMTYGMDLPADLAANMEEVLGNAQVQSGV